MASLYAEDGVLVSPAGPIIRERDALRTYYVGRFASGAYGHTVKAFEVHALGDGGYWLSHFSVSTPAADGGYHQAQGTIVTVYQRGPEGWRMRLVEPSVPEKDGK
jgi:ketosteroid isomerase-like protein